MKHITSLNKLKNTLSLGVLSLGLLFAGNSTASAQACLTTSIPINTGYNPATNTVIPIGSQDPYWKITALTPTLTPAQPLSYGAFAVLGNPAWPNPWPTSTTSNWISFNTFPSYSTIGGTNYAMTIRRSFRTCKDDKFNVYLKQFTFDQTIQIFLDGTLMYTNTNAAQYTSFITTSFVSTTLAAGTHNLDVIVYNNAGHYSDDGHGLNITGNIMSATGIPSLISEAAGCERYQCGVPTLIQGSLGNTALNEINSVTQNSPNPFRHDTRIVVSVKEMKSNARLAVYNLNGQQVMSLPVSKTGQTELTVNAEGLTPGIYVYSLSVDGKIAASKRMIIAR